MGVFLWVVCVCVGVWGCVCVSVRGVYMCIMVRVVGVC